MPEPAPADIAAALQQCREMIRKGSKSFSLAAHLFEPSTRNAAVFLYGWCRYCDDQVDQAARAGAREELERRLEHLRESTRAAFSEHPPDEAVFIALHTVAKRYGIPAHYALELIEGMAMDVRPSCYRTFDQLLLYCYRVAGTVGLMMSHVMGVRDERALEHAAHLGTAMQLTNIARDIIEDAAMGRVYLPLEWLEEVKLDPARIAAPENRHRLAWVTQRLLQTAERYYRSGDSGLWHLSFRSACAVAAARHVYSEIGARLLRRGAGAWDQRIYVTGARKLWVVGRGMAQVFGSLPARLARPWSPAPIGIVWTHPAGAKPRTG